MAFVSHENKTKIFFRIFIAKKSLNNISREIDRYTRSRFIVLGFNSKTQHEMDNFFEWNELNESNKQISLMQTYTELRREKKVEGEIK